MCNETLGLVTFIAAFVLMVLMYRSFGKQGLIAWVAVGTIAADTRVVKTVEIFDISAVLSNVMFASIYLAIDILDDVYGCKVAKRAVWLGFSSALIMIIVMQLSLRFIPAPEDTAQKALHTIFDVVPRIALGSIIAYIIGQRIDVFIFPLIRKVFSSDKTFLVRAYDNTFLSSVVNIALFVAIAFIGSLPGTVVFKIFITTYVLELTPAVSNVPFGYIAKSFCRKGEIDELDQGY